MCNPVEDDQRFQEMSRCGKCGDDDVVFGGSLGAAVLPAPAIALVPPGLVGRAFPDVSLRLALVFLMPPTPPPRFALS